MRFNSAVIGQKIEVVGWAYAVLWICTLDGYSIHMYNGKKILGKRRLPLGYNLNAICSGDIIADIQVSELKFSVYGSRGWILSIYADNCDTARIFKRNSSENHWVFERRKMVLA